MWPASSRGGVEQVVAADDVPADVAVGAQGKAFLISRSRSTVRLRVAEPGARFGPWRTLFSSGTARVVDAAVAPDGTGVIVLQSHRRVQVASFSADFSRGSRVVVA